MVYLFNNWTLKIRNSNAEFEAWAFLIFWSNRDISFKLLHNHFANGKAKSHSTLINLLTWVDFAKEFKKFINISSLYSYPCVINFSHKHILISVEFDFDSHSSLESKFKCISNQVIKNLFVPFWITFDQFREVLFVMYFKFQIQTFLRCL